MQAYQATNQKLKETRYEKDIRTTQHRIINSKLSLRRSEADAGASLKFIILGVTRTEKRKTTLKAKVLDVMKRIPKRV